MKKLLLLFVFVITCMTLAAQDYKVLSVELLPTDMSARENVKLDEKERQCALFRIATQNISPEMREGFHFESDYGSWVVNRDINGGEIWLWVSPGIKTLRIIHDRLGRYELHLNNYMARVEPLMTYRIVIQGTETEPNPPVEKVEQYLVFHITPANVTLEVDGETWPVSWEGIARKRVEMGIHAYQVQAEDYLPVSDSVTLSNPDSIVTIEVKLQPTKAQKYKVLKKKTFVTLNGAYSNAPQASFGFSVGQVKKFGWFVSVMSNGNFSGFSYAGDCDAQGYTSEGYLLAYSGEVSKMRLSVMGGGVMHLVGPLYARVGAGYGNRTLRWRTESGKWMRNTAFSTSGIDLSAGLQLQIEGFVVTAEAVTTSFKTLEAKIGLGYAF